MDNFKDVKSFNNKFGLLESDHPRHLTKILLKERIEFMLEELSEFADASGMVLDAEFDGEQLGSSNIADQADALIDLVYVAMGTAVMMGLPWQELWGDVHRANMCKVRGFTTRGHRVDLAKPDDWEPPQTTKILSAAGYNALEDCADHSDAVIQAIGDVGVNTKEFKSSPPSVDLFEVPTKDLLNELENRGGHPGEVAKAILLCLKKSGDYNADQDQQNPHKIDRSKYFPFGTCSYAQMIHTKSQRFMALTTKELMKEEPNFEGLKDTAYDLINYCGFFLADARSNKL